MISPILALLNFALVGAFLAVTAVAILHTILEEKSVTLDTIFGGICVYLLMGVGWAEAYELLESLHPGSFDLSRVVASPPIREGMLFAYFSFVTLTTLGYGEIVPMTAQAQSLVILEAVAGPLFLAIFIARLVGLHMASQRRRGD